MSEELITASGDRYMGTVRGCRVEAGGGRLQHGPQLISQAFNYLGCELKVIFVINRMVLLSASITLVGK